MTKIYVSATIEDSISAHGNTQPPHLIVRVEDEKGTPVEGLNIANFSIGSEIIGVGGSLINIRSVSIGKDPGVYLLKLLPLSGQTWKSGVHIFSVTASQERHKGLTFCCRFIN